MEAELLKLIAKNTEHKTSFQIIVSDNESSFNTRFNPKLELDSFIDLLPKRKKLQRKRLRKDLSLLEKVSRNYHRLLHFHLHNLSEKHREKKRKMRKKRKMN